MIKDLGEKNLPIKPQLHGIDLEFFNDGKMKPRLMKWALGIQLPIKVPERTFAAADKVRV
jgi:hypothetical protein